MSDDTIEKLAQEMSAESNIEAEKFERLLRVDIAYSDDPSPTLWRDSLLAVSHGYKEPTWVTWNTSTRREELGMRADALIARERAKVRR